MILHLFVFSKNQQEFQCHEMVQKKYLQKLSLGILLGHICRTNHFEQMRDLFHQIIVDENQKKDFAAALP